MPERARYTGVAIALHWLLALLIAGNLAGGLVFGNLLASSDPALQATGRTIIGFHKALGISIIALTVLRIGWRLEIGRAHV